MLETVRPKECVKEWSSFLGYQPSFIVTLEAPEKAFFENKKKIKIAGTSIQNETHLPH